MNNIDFMNNVDFMNSIDFINNIYFMNCNLKNMNIFHKNRFDGREKK